MPKVNITEAAKLAGITRQYLHKKYIKTGTITVEKDNAGHPLIDTSEIMRVFGNLKDDSKQVTQSYREITTENDGKTTALQMEIQLLREQLVVATSRETAAAEREKWMQGKIDQLAGQLDSTTRLLEHKESVTTEKEAQIKQQQGAINTLRKESLWRRLLGKTSSES